MSAEAVAALCDKAKAEHPGITFGQIWSLNYIPAELAQEFWRYAVGRYAEAEGIDPDEEGHR